jgi:hypothetical protein
LPGAGNLLHWLDLVQCGCWVQAADAAAARHEQLVAQNQALERDYERFKKKKNLQERIAVSGWLLRWSQIGA